jgi:hypothetical protein
MSPSGMNPNVKDWCEKENGGVYGFDGKKQHKLFAKKTNRQIIIDNISIEIEQLEMRKKADPEWNAENEQYLLSEIEYLARMKAEEKGEKQ